MTRATTTPHCRTGTPGVKGSGTARAARSPPALRHQCDSHHRDAGNVHAHVDVSRLTVRATDDDGDVQTGERTPRRPGAAAEASQPANAG